MRVRSFLTGNNRQESLAAEHLSITKKNQEGERSTVIKLDFKELASGERAGRGLEVLVRELGEKQNFRVEWSGVGPDAGKDHYFHETIQGELSGTKCRKWLVQCKDNSLSGKTVIGLGETYNIETKLQEHSCDGFLLVCTTEVGGNLKRIIDNIESQGRYSAAVWDSHKLTSLLAEPRNEFIFRRFFPKSYKVYFENLPEVLQDFKQKIEARFGLKNATPIDNDHHNNWQVIEEDYEGYYIQFSFPEISLDGYAEEANEINLNVRSRMLKYKYDFCRGKPLTAFLDFGYEAIDEEIIQARKVLWKNDDKHETNPKQSILIFCEVVSATQHFVSIIVYLSQYATGNLHPNGHSDVINFSVKPVCPLGLAEIVDLRALPLIAKLCVSGIMKRKADIAAWTSDISEEATEGPYRVTECDQTLEPDIQCGNRLRPTLENFSRFCLLNDGLMFLFDPGEVADAWAGTSQIVIPYSSLARYLQPQVKHWLGLK